MERHYNRTIFTEQDMDSDALAMYPIGDRKTKKLISCKLVRVIQNTNNNTVLVFLNPYKMTCIDLVIKNGEIYVTDEYGATMPRDDIFYINAENL